MNRVEKLRMLYRAWRYRHRVESGEVAFLLRHLRPGQTAVDVGAHKGAFTYWMRRAVGRRGRVISFEPQPELASYLRQVCDGFGFSEVTVVHAGLSSAPGTMPLFRPDDAPSPGATLETDRHAARPGLSVPVDTLDTYFARQGGRPVHFIKCDVEGHELHVFRGGREILREDRPTLLFECEQRHHGGRTIEPIFKYLADLGYRGRFVFRGRLLSLTEFDPVVHQDPGGPDYANNFVFQPAA